MGIKVNSTVLFTVRRYSYQWNHNNWDCHGTTRFLADGGRQNTFGCSFDCECGESMHDGDPFMEELYDKTRRIVHANCASLA